MKPLLLVLAVLLAALALVEPALAQQSPLQMTTSPLAGGGTQYSVPVQTLLFLTVLSFLPAMLLMMTSFTRIVIVLSLLRMALGTQASPPNQVLIGLALFLGRPSTASTTRPTFRTANRRSRSSRPSAPARRRCAISC